MLFKDRSPSGGLGIFTSGPIEKGATIYEFKGPRKKLEDIGQDELDYNLQIGSDLYIGPSGELDDFFNHSCAPNSWVKIKEDDAKLISLVDISSGAEVVFDYAVTCTEPDWSIKCKCGSSNCRKTVGGFMKIPRRRRMYYLKLGIVPEYVLKGTLL